MDAMSRYTLAQSAKSFCHIFMAKQSEPRSDAGLDLIWINNLHQSHASVSRESMLIVSGNNRCCCDVSGLVAFLSKLQGAITHGSFHGGS